MNVIAIYDACKLRSGFANITITSAGSISQKKVTPKPALSAEKTLSNDFRKIQDGPMNPMPKKVSPSANERGFVKTPNKISSLTSPKDPKPPIIRYPVEFTSVQNANQKKEQQNATVLSFSKVKRFDLQMMRISIQVSRQHKSMLIAQQLQHLAESNLCKIVRP